MRTVSLLFLVASLLACGTNQATNDPVRVYSVGVEQRAEEPSEEPVPQTCTKEELGTATLLPPPKHRTRHRMNLDQLQHSLKRVMGGLEWSSGQEKIWPQKAKNLGVPDFMESVREDLSSNLLFDKTLGDAARDLCPALLALEEDKAPQDRVFLLNVEPNDTFENNEDGIVTTLRRLILLYHGRHLEEADPAFEPWLNFFTNAMSQVETPPEAWTALCVALVMHPEFQSY